jgi:tRNA-2-methylthio-N6-dimethylallyladenosine synthase
MEDQIAPEIMDDRLQRLHARINAHQIAFNSASIGKETEILVERRGKHPGQMIGRTPWLQSVHVEAEAAPGDIVSVKLTAAGPNSMTGALLAKPPLTVVEGAAA